MKVIIKIENETMGKAVAAIMPERLKAKAADRIGLALRNYGTIGESAAIRIVESGTERTANEFGHSTWESYTRSGGAQDWNDYTKIDPATAMGALLKLLNEPLLIVIPAVTSKRNGVVRADKSGIDVGCEFVTRAKIEECYRALFTEASDVRIS